MTPEARNDPLELLFRTTATQRSIKNFVDGKRKKHAHLFINVTNDGVCNTDFKSKNKRNVLFLIEGENDDVFNSVQSTPT